MLHASTHVSDRSFLLRQHGQAVMCRDIQHATQVRRGWDLPCPVARSTNKLSVDSISQRFLHNVGTRRQVHANMRGSRTRRVRAQSRQMKFVQIRALPEDPLKICSVERVSHTNVVSDHRTTTPSIAQMIKVELVSREHASGSMLKSATYLSRCINASLEPSLMIL